jgi:hypothetical protein
MAEQEIRCPAAEKDGFAAPAEVMLPPGPSWSAALSHTSTRSRSRAAR